MSETKLLQTEILGDTIILTPNQNLGELDFHEIDAEGNATLHEFDERGLRNVIIDLHKTDYCGSSALGMFVRLHKKVLKLKGRMIVAGVSGHELEVMRITKLDELWTICRTREVALNLLRCP